MNMKDLTHDLHRRLGGKVENRTPSYCYSTQCLPSQCEGMPVPSIVLMKSTLSASGTAILDFSFSKTTLAHHHFSLTVSLIVHIGFIFTTRKKEVCDVGAFGHCPRMNIECVIYLAMTLAIRAGFVRSAHRAIYSGIAFTYLAAHRSSRISSVCIAPKMNISPAV